MTPADLKTVGVLGAGTMGAGIAEQFAEKGCEVILWNRSTETLCSAEKRIRSNQQQLIDADLLTECQAQEARARIRTTCNLKDLGPTQLISENVAEILELKQNIFSQVECIVGKDILLASNTSGIPISTLQEKCRFPERVVGMHWWNPPHIIPLIEIIKGAQTDETVVQTAFDTASWLGKRPIIVKKDIPGFVGNRMQFALAREALWLLENNVATAEDIDTAVSCGFGFRYPVFGPLRAADFTGLDTMKFITDNLFPMLDDTKESPEILRHAVEQGNYGAKTGKGLYDYAIGEVEELIAERNKELLHLIKRRFEATKKSKPTNT